MKRATRVRGKTPTRPSRAAAQVTATLTRLDAAFACVAFLAGVAVYANTLGHGFVWDDLIVLDSRVRFYRSALDAFFEPTNLRGFPGVFRPLTFASFWLDQRLWWRNAFGFHLTSVLLHALNAALVYGLARLFGCVAFAALGGALLFAVHPIHTEAVAWVSGRVDVLATTFTLLAVTIALRSRTASGVASTLAVRPAAAGVAATLAVALFAFAAAASKEPGVVTPLLIAAAGTLPRRDDTTTAASGPSGPSLSDALHRVPWRHVAAAAAGVGAYLVLRQVNRAADAAHLEPPTLASIGTFVRAFGFYVERLLVPMDLSAYVPVVPDGAVPWSFAALGAIAAALALRAPRLRVAVFWILVTLAPSMLIILAHISVTMVAERYLYLPSVGLALLAAFALTTVAVRDRPRLAAATVLAAVALGAGATVQRNRVWHDEVTLWSEVTRRTPGYALPNMNLGLALADAGRLDEAEVAYRAAVDAEGSVSTKRDTLVNLGHLQLRRDRLDDALGFFERATAIASSASAEYGVGAVYRARARAALARGDAQSAVADFARAAAALSAALRIDPRHYKSEYLLGTVLYQSGDLTAALEHFRRAVAIAPDTDVGREAAEAARELAAWLADPTHASAR